MADDGGFFTRLGRKLDVGTKKANDTIANHLAEVQQAVGLDAPEAALHAGVGKVLDKLGDHKDAAYFNGMAALFRSGVNRAHFSEAADKMNASITAEYSPKVKASREAQAGPITSQASAEPHTLREKVLAEEAFLKAAGYGAILSRHGEQGGGLDGIRGRDVIAAENLYRRDHSASIQGGESVREIPAAPATPPMPKAAKLREV